MRHHLRVAAHIASLIAEAAYYRARRNPLQFP